MNTVTSIHSGAGRAPAGRGHWAGATLALAVAAWTLPAQAQEEEVVFSAIPSRTGSLSMTGADPAVVLTWSDPQDIAGLAHFRLTRDGTTIATIPYAIRSGAEIDTLYARPENARRAAELAAVVEAQLGGAPAAFGDAVASLLGEDAFFAHFGGRLDPALATARGLGWTDKGVSGTHTYALYGAITSGTTTTEVALGRAVVDASTTWQAPAGVGFRVLPGDALARCDAPEAMRAHGVLALDWDLPGGGGPERFALSQAIAGWDVYRSATPSASSPPRDLAAEGALLPHDNRGQVAFAGLVKVNDVPVLATPGLQSEEPTYAGWAPEAAQLTLSRKEVLASGMQPGERYAFYLVPRDVTGNYGATTSVVGRVPDALPPATPWDLRAVRRPMLNGGATPDTLMLRWSQVNVLNFVEDHARRTYCNLEDAKFTRELAYVPADQVCGDGEGGRVSLRTVKYDVYRFASPEEAQGFVDSDGDGVNDALERTSVGDPAATPQLSAPGSACDPTKAPLGAPSFKVGTVTAASATLDRQGREVLEWADAVAEADLGRVFWYRVVAVADGGARSPMSAPVRAMFPAFRQTPRRYVDPPLTCDEVITWHPCQPGSVPATDLTGDAATVTFSCGSKSWTWPLHGAPPGAGLPTDALVSDPWPQGMCTNDNGGFPFVCAGLPVTITYYDATGDVIASLTTGKYTSDNCLCATLDEICTDPPPKVIPGGTEPVPYDPATECVSVYRRIGDQLQRVETICDELVTDYSDMAPTDLLGGPVCLYQVVQTASGQLSARFPLGCEENNEAAAEIPTVAGLSFPVGGTTATVRIVSPNQPVLGFIAELSRADGSERKTTFVRLGETGALGEVTATVEDVGTAPGTGETEEWCLRARTVVSNTAAATITDTLSDWSAELCVARLGADAVEPEYIPWPEIPTPPEAEPLEAIYVDGDGFGLVYLGTPALECTDQNVPRCEGTDEVKGDEVADCLRPIVPLPGSGECPTTCRSVDNALIGQLGFVAYRQGRSSALMATSDLAQISPRIDYVHCTTIAALNLGGSDYANLPDGTDVLADPWVGLADFSGTFGDASGEPWSGDALFFVDRAPHIAGWEYRYQFVYFDANGEITKTRTSNWIVAD